MLVLAIMAAIAGITWPALMRPWSRSQVQEAAGELAEQLLDARMRAIEQSRVYELRWKPGTGEYQIVAPDDASLETPRSTSQQLSADASHLQTANGELADPVAQSLHAGLENAATFPAAASQPPATKIEQKLPNDVKFESPALLLAINSAADENEQRAAKNQTADTAARAAPNDASSTDASSTDDTRSSANVNLTWKGGIWFYPDGSTSSGRWQLISPERHRIEVILRGMTGTVKVTRPTTIGSLAHSRSELRRERRCQFIAR